MDATDGPLKVVVRVSRRRSYNPIYWVNNILQILLKNKGYRESIEGTPNTSISNNRSTTNSNKLIKVEALEGAIIIAIDAVMVLQQRASRDSGYQDRIYWRNEQGNWPGGREENIHRNNH